jgi:putative peptidoglycan lipid II flippase
MEKDAEVASKNTSVLDSVHSIARSAAGFFSGTALSRITGMIRDVSLAYSFGTNSALAAFFVAFRLSHVLRRLFGEGALQSAFVPLFEEIRKDSPKKAFYFFRDLNILWSLLLSFFIVIGMGGLFAYLKWTPGGFSQNEVLYLTALMLPSLLPICLFGLNASLLQCEKKYFTVGIAPVAFNIVFALTALFLREYSAESAMPYLAVSIVVGCTLQWIVTFIPALRICADYFRNGFWEQMQLLSKEVRNLWKPLSLGMLGVSAVQINSAIDALFARVADPEGPAELWFSLRFQQLPLALFGIALSGALLPPLARAIQGGDKKQFLLFLEFSIRKTVALLIPCTVYLLVLGMNVIHCVYGRGDFQSHSIFTTTGCLHGYVFALVPMGLVLIFAPAFYAKKEYLIPMRGAIIALIINTLFDAILVFCLDWKAVSIAIATSIASCMNAWYLYHQLKKEWGPLMSHEGFVSCCKLLLCSLGAGLSTFFFLGATQGYPVFFGCFQESVSLLPHSLYERISIILAASLVFAGSLFTLAKLMKANDLLSLLKRAR